MAHGFPHLGFVGVVLRGVDVAVAGLEGVEAGGDGDGGRGLVEAETEAGHGEGGGVDGDGGGDGVIGGTA